jgi:hypothetical protein
VFAGDAEDEKNENVRYVKFSEQQQQQQQQQQ